MCQCAILQVGIAKTFLSCEDSAIKKCMGFHGLCWCIDVEGFMFENNICWDPKAGCGLHVSKAMFVLQVVK